MYPITGQQLLHLPLKTVATQSATDVSKDTATKSEPEVKATATPEAAPATQPAAASTETEKTSSTGNSSVAAAPVPAVNVAQPTEAIPETTPAQPKPAQPEKAAESPAAVAPAQEPADQQQAVLGETPAAPTVAKPVESKPVEVPPINLEAPTFDTVRVEPTGEAVIAGRATPGAEVFVKLDSQLVGKAIANAEGSFVLVPDKPLPAGSGSLTLEVIVGDKVATSTNSVAVAVKEQGKGEPLVAVLTPEAPTKIIQAPSAEKDKQTASAVVLDAVDYDGAGNIIFSGRSVPGSTVRLYIDNQAAGEMTTDASGHWMFGAQIKVAPGRHTLRADEISADGKVKSRVELPFLREDTAKIASVSASGADPATAESSTAAAPGTSAEGNGATSATAEPPRIVIQPGNNLWKLSRQIYGRGIEYTVIYEANKDQIRNPNLIYPGQVFSMPSKQQ